MPQLAKRDDPELRRRQVARQLEYLEAYLRPDSVFLELGAGDGEVTAAVAPRVRRAIALDVSATIADTGPDGNIERVICDGRSVPVPPGTVDVAFSNQLMEHLHPDDALEQLRNVWEALRPGGVYICITPNRLSGPHDVSRHFDDVATGFHLKEYTNGELAELLHEAGFESVASIVPRAAGAVTVPVALIVAAESALAHVPGRFRRRALRGPLHKVVNVRLIARKPVAVEAVDDHRRGRLGQAAPPSRGKVTAHR